MLLEWELLFKLFISELFFSSSRISHQKHLPRELLFFKIARFIGSIYFNEDGSIIELFSWCSEFNDCPCDCSSTCFCSSIGSSLFEFCELGLEWKCMLFCLLEG